MQSKNSDGFGIIELVIIIVIIGVIGLVGYNTWNGLQKKTTVSQQPTVSTGGHVCYEKSPHLYCYDLTTKKHTEMTGAQLPTADTHYIVPSPDASQYLVVAEIASQKTVNYAYYVADAKLQNPKKLNNIHGLFARSAAWKSDSSGFYYVGTDPSYPDLDPTDFDNPPSQILYYDVAQQTVKNLTKNTTNTSYSNPVLSADGRTLVVLSPDSPTSGATVVTIQTDTAQMRVIDPLPSKYAWSEVRYDRVDDAIIAIGTATNSKQEDTFSGREIVIADILKSNLTGSGVPQAQHGTLFDVLGNTYVFHNFDKESLVLKGFDLLPRSGGSATFVPFNDPDSSLLFVLPNEQNPLL